MDRIEYAEAVLMRTVGVKRRGARRGLAAWMIAESGHAHCDGVDGAKYNPLNTTLNEPGATLWNETPGVKSYPTLGIGLEATSSTLLDPRYNALRAVLAKRWVRTTTVICAISESPWGTTLETLLGALGTYRRDRRFWNRIQVGP